MTTTYTSDTHRAELRQDGLLAVYSHRGPVVVETTFEDGEATEKVATAADGGSLGELAAAMELRTALSQCNFADDEIEAMIAVCQDAPWSYCPRQG